MESIANTLDRTQYSTVAKANSNYSTVNSNSTVSYNEEEILSCIADLIVNPDYKPWYGKQLRTLGYDRFMELVQKARAGSDTAATLFKWMLMHNGMVK